jgi:broad specificity phosphatase PhoE
MNRIRVYLLRHGAASHLLIDYNKVVSYDKFVTLLLEWEKASLTPVGEEEVAKKFENLKNNYLHLLYSPLKRTKQTAKAFISNPHVVTAQAIPSLKEIRINPPRLFSKRRFKIRTWVALCVLKSLNSMKIIHYIKQAGSVLKEIEKVGEDTLVISHQARIITILLYCLQSLKWRIIKIDVKPAGISIIVKKKKI